MRGRAQVADAVSHIPLELQLQGGEDFVFPADLDEPTCLPTVAPLLSWHSCLRSHPPSKARCPGFGWDRVNSLLNSWYSAVFWI